MIAITSTDGRGARAQLAHQLDAVLVGQIDVEEEEVWSELLDERTRIAASRRIADDLEAGHALDELAMHRDGHEVVVHDERPDHDRTPSTECSGSRTVKRAPSTFSTCIVPCRRLTSWLTSARPRPRLCWPSRAILVVKPSRKISSVSAGSTPGTGVVDRDHELALLDVQRDVDVTAASARGGRLERVVDQVAEHRDERADVLELLRQLGRVDVELDAVLARDGGLAEQQRGEDRVADAVDERRGELLVQERRAVDLLDGVVVAAELDQAADHVQPVLELVLLRAQRVGELAHVVQLA